MARILNTIKMKDAICRIFDRAEKMVCIISPYLSFSNQKNGKWKEILEAIKDAGKNQVPVFIICRDITADQYDDLSKKERDLQNQQRSLNVLSKYILSKHLHIAYCKKLHAKCYFNERDFVVSSLNLTFASVSNDNKELGILMKTGEDDDIIKQLFLYVNTIVNDSKDENGKNFSFVNASGAMQSNEVYHFEDVGHCIYCGKDIKFDLKNPICSSCLPELNRGWKPDKTYCHACGISYSPKKITIMEKPLHYKCWKNRCS